MCGILDLATVLSTSQSLSHSLVVPLLSQ